MISDGGRVCTMTPSAPIQIVIGKLIGDTDKDSSQLVMDWKKVVTIRQGAYIDSVCNDPSSDGMMKLQSKPEVGSQLSA